MPTEVRVTIYDRNIDAMFMPGGDTWRWLEGVGREHMAMALVEVPRRTNQLAASHNLALTPYKRRGVRYSVGNYARHAYWVHEGTDTPIVARHGFTDGGAPKPSRFKSGRVTGMYTPGGLPMLHLKPWGIHGYKSVYAVRGQEANPWIARAAEFALAKYGYVGNDFPGW
jgi:hypothetical protein